jgi:hypothetical protein
MPSTATENENVRLMSEAQIPAIPFAVALPTSTLQNFDEPTPKGAILPLMGNNGVVGSIILLRNSVMVWVGWGKLDLSSSQTTQSNDSGFGKGMLLVVKGKELISLAGNRLYSLHALFVFRNAGNGAAGGSHAPHKLQWRVWNRFQ